MPSTSRAEKEVQNLTARLNEMKDEYEVGMSSKEKIMSLLERKGTVSKPDSKII